MNLIREYNMSSHTDTIAPNISGRRLWVPELHVYTAGNSSSGPRLKLTIGWTIAQLLQHFAI